MLRFARFSQFNGARFWIVLFIVTGILSEITWYILLFDIRQFMRFLENSAHFGMTFAYFWFWTPTKKKRTKILRKLWCTRLQIGVEGVKGEEGIFTYPPTFFLPLVLSSPEPKARVSYCHSAPSVVRPSVRPSGVNFSHFRLLLQNRLIDFDETW